MNYINNLLSCYVFENIRDVIEYKFNIEKKLARNWTALYHATGAIFLTSCHIYLTSSYNNYNLNNANIKLLYNIIKIFSTGYFINDITYIFRFEKVTPIKFGYIYHHLATSYMLYIGSSLYADKLLFWGELSNIPTYFIYNYLKKEKITYIEEYKLQFWKYTQKILYTGIRIPILGYYTYNVFSDYNNYTNKIILLPLYVMGVAWSIKIIKK